MTIIREIEQKISDAFQGGEILTRELRLTSREADYIRTHYQASLTPLTGGDGAWYEMSFRGAEN